MIVPQKFFRQLGNNKLKLGLSVYELLFCSILMSLSSLINLGPNLSMLIGFVSYCLIFIKNTFFKNGEISSFLNRKDHLQMQRIEVNVKKN